MLSSKHNAVKVNYCNMFIKKMIQIRFCLVSKIPVFSTAFSLSHFYLLALPGFAVQVFRGYNGAHTDVKDVIYREKREMS